MKNYSLKKISIVFLAISISARCQAVIWPHFYTTNPLFEEPRFEEPCLMSGDVFIYAGATCESRPYRPCTQRCEKTKLLDIYGTHNMHLLGEGVPCKDLTNPADITLTQLSLIPRQDDFGQLSFCGKFKIAQADFTFIQNFDCGFYCLFYIPVSSLDISCISYKDLSPEGQIPPSKHTPIWESFLMQFDTILERYNLDINPCSSSGLGDIGAFIGWTRNYEETEFFDFIDISILLGILIPSGKKRNPNKVFSLPHGYNGHWGIPIVVDIATGLCEWMTLAAHVEIIGLFERKEVLRMKTAWEQSGLIKLAKGSACVRPGTIYRIGALAKADHCIRGLSFAIGYTYAARENDRLYPCSTMVFDPNIVNSDEMFKRWKMHTIHFTADYDFNREHVRFGPRVGIFYNLQVGGERVFKTNTGGVQFGLDFAWKF